MLFCPVVNVRNEKTMISAQHTRWQGTLGLITATSYLLLHLLKKIVNEQKFDRSIWYLDNTHAANANLRGTEIP